MFQARTSTCEVKLLEFWVAVWGRAWKQSYFKPKYIGIAEKSFVLTGN